MKRAFVAQVSAILQYMRFGMQEVFLRQTGRLQLECLEGYRFVASLLKGLKVQKDEKQLLSGCHC